jgi:hypothetical protein
MMQYQYGRIKILAENLKSAGIAEDIIEQIMQDGEHITKTDSPQRKAAWMREAMLRMDRLLEKDTRHAVREACACCLGGMRLKLSKEIAKKHATFDERIRAANETHMVFGHSVAVQEDGKILVSFSPEGLEHYRCVCLPKAEGPISITYCYCCGGHAKHHLQIALDMKLDMKVRSSALSSGGKRPCTFLFTIKE